MSEDSAAWAAIHSGGGDMSSSSSLLDDRSLVPDSQILHLDLTRPRENSKLLRFIRQLFDFGNLELR